VRSDGACGADGCGAPAWPCLCATAWRVELRSVVSVRAAAALRSPVRCGGPVTAVLRSRAAYRPAAHAAAASQPPSSARSWVDAARRAPRLQVASALGRHGVGTAAHRADAFQNRPSAYGRNPLSTRSWCAACVGAPCSALAEPVSTLHRRLDGARPSRGGRKCVSCTAARRSLTVSSLRAERRSVQRAAEGAAGSRNTP